MSEETQTTQDSTSADIGSEAQAQAPSEGVVLKPAAAIQAEQAAAQAESSQPKADEASAPKEGAKDLGLLKDTKAESEGAPETYEAFALPEGIEINEQESALLQSVAKEMGLPQAEANRAAEAAARFADKLAEEHLKAVEEYKAANEKEWKAQPDADERLLLAKKALDHAGLTDYIMESGYQYDAKLFKAFSEFGKLISEAKVIVGSESSPAPTSANPYVNSPEFQK